MYAKVFAQIFDSSLAEDYTTRHVFMDLLVLADPEGHVDMTFEAIARRTNVPVKIIRDSIRKLCKSDVNSRSIEEEGKRLILIDKHRSWGWQIVNFKSYRSMKNEVGRREYMRLYMQNRRAKEAASVNSGKPSKQNVNIRSKQEEEGKGKGPVNGFPPDSQGAECPIPDGHDDKPVWKRETAEMYKRLGVYSPSLLSQWFADGHPEWAIQVAIRKTLEAGKTASYVGGILRNEAPEYAGLKRESRAAPIDSTTRLEAIGRKLGEIPP